MVFQITALLNSLLGALLAVLIAMLYWQRGMRSYKEARYAEEIKKSAEEAKAATLRRQDSFPG